LIRAVISDFGGVLTTPLVRSFLAYQEHSGISIGDLGQAMARVTEESGAHPLYELERGRITEREFLGGIERALGGGAKLDGFSEKYFEHLDRNEPMIDCMRGLRDRGFRMALLTNNVREWEPLWRAKLPEIDEIFELVVDSAFVGMRKPEREIYDLTLERLGGSVSASECVFVDDTDVNCHTAASLGMVAVHFVNAEQAIGEIEAAVGGAAASAQ
jgi:epoxide hydrolase-like predicted phosphatase